MQFCISGSIIVAASEGYLLLPFFLALMTNKESHLLSATASQEKRISLGTASSARAVRLHAAHSLDTQTDNSVFALVLSGTHQVFREGLQLLIATCTWAKSVCFL